MNTEVGIRELKARLSAYLRLVRSGDSIIITDRGKPIGRIVPLAQPTPVQLDVLRSSGLIDWNGELLPQIAPAAKVTDSKTVAEILIEDRQ